MAAKKILQTSKFLNIRHLLMLDYNLLLYAFFFA